MHALILGSTGLVGNLLLKRLLADDTFTRVTIVTRNPSVIEHPKLHNYINALKPGFKIEGIDAPVDILFSCLGTTRKRTPDLNLYEHIEVGIPEMWIDHLLERGLKQVHFISAVGVNPNSKNFYISIKSKAELMLKTYADRLSVMIYRPSFIVGARKEKRLSEQIILGIYRGFSPLFSFGKMRRYRHIHADKIAESMHNNSINPPSSHYTIIENEHML